jgi:DNA-binding CsgD family transcriptional regulator
MDGVEVFPPEPQAQILHDIGSRMRSALTPQELRCLVWCKEGKTNWEIGEILLISEKTVEFHMCNAMKKLDATNRMTAVVLGIKAGLITL